MRATVPTRRRIPKPVKSTVSTRGQCGGGGPSLGKIPLVLLFPLEEAFASSGGGKKSGLTMGGSLLVLVVLLEGPVELLLLLPVLIAWGLLEDDEDPVLESLLPPVLLLGGEVGVGLGLVDGSANDNLRDWS